MKQSIRTMIWGALALVSSVCTAWAKYKPVDTSDIKGKQRMELQEAVRDVNKMPILARDCFVAEQLGICFGKDGQGVGYQFHGRPATHGDKAFIVGSDGRLAAWMSATMPAGSQWGRSYSDAMKFKQEAMLSLMTGRVNLVVRNTAKYLMKEMPDDLRWTLLATLDKKLYYQDGRSASEKKHVYSLECGAKFSYYGDWENGYCMGANGEEIKVWEVFCMKEGRWDRYRRWCDIVRRCANLVGDKDILALFPEEVKAIRKHYKQRLAQMKEQMDEANKALPPEGAALPKGAQCEEGIAALRRMSTGMRRAWLAENMGFCYTQSDAPAYTAPHIANDNALFVDEQGKERKLSEVATDKMTPDWVAATKAALAVGHEQVAAPFKEELKALAVQTATHILKSIDETPRYSWLAEMNHLIFSPNGQSAYPPGGQTNSVESGFKVHAPNVNYGGKLYYNPQGKISQPSASNAGWKRWNMLFRCADVAGIEAINAEFKADVDAMRAVYEKSPFYKK